MSRPTQPIMSESDPIVVYRAHDLLDASQVKSELEAAGFLCEMLGAQHSTMMLGGGIAIGIRLVVPASQAKAALEFLGDRHETKTLEDQD